uniref:Endonuclease/exonuclease/phosphatase domain-containing protein n=1 Tax=Leersia perrieri TaxID=77586 RepID=A0A0D9VU89_9ORYZ
MASTVKRALRCLLEGIRSVQPRPRRRGAGAGGGRSSKAAVPRVVVIRRLNSKTDRRRASTSGAGAPPPLDSAATAVPVTIRVATFNAAMFSTAPAAVLPSPSATDHDDTDADATTTANADYDGDGEGYSRRRGRRAPANPPIPTRRPKKGILKPAASATAPPPTPASPHGERRRLRRHVSISLPNDNDINDEMTTSATARLVTRQPPATTTTTTTGSGRWRSVFGAVWEHQHNYQRQRQQKLKQKQQKQEEIKREAEATTSSWRGRRRTSVEEVVRETGADVVALQNVRAEEGRGMRPLSELAEGLGMRYVFAESWAPEYGNAVLSRWPIKRWRACRLADPSDFRNVLRVTIDVPGAGEVNVYCTHLDHLDESLRMRQVNSILRFADGRPHILAGGLNALDATDYSADRWAAIAKFHEEIGKPAPKAEVMRHLKEKRYVDAKDFAGESEAFVVVPHGQDVQGTCKYGTRVDYILASPNSPYKFVPGSYAVVSSQGTSDHHIIRVDVTIDINAGASRTARQRRRRRVVKMTSKNSSKGIWTA